MDTSKQKWTSQNKFVYLEVNKGESYEFFKKYVWGILSYKEIKRGS